MELSPLTGAMWQRCKSPLGLCLTIVIVSIKESISCPSRIWTVLALLHSLTSRRTSSFWGRFDRLLAMLVSLEVFLRCDTFLHFGVQYIWFLLCLDLFWIFALQTGHCFVMTTHPGGSHLFTVWKVSRPHILTSQSKVVHCVAVWNLQSSWPQNYSESTQECAKTVHCGLVTSVRFWNHSIWWRKHHVFLVLWSAPFYKLYIFKSFSCSVGL